MQTIEFKRMDVFWTKGTGNSIMSYSSILYFLGGMCLYLKRRMDFLNKDDKTVTGSFLSPQ